MDNPAAVSVTSIDPALAVIEALVGASTAALCVLDDLGRCVAANEPFAHALGESRTVLLGRRITPPDAADVRPFSPGGGRAWRMVTLPPTGAGTREVDGREVDGREDVLRAVVDALPVIINARDGEGRYLFMNRYQARLYGVSATDIAGRSLGDVLGPACGEETRQLDREVLVTHQALPPFETRYAGVDGILRDWLLVKNPIVDAHGTVSGVVTLGIDITDRKRVEESQARARQEAEEACRARTHFLATVGHELRMPLNAVIGFSEFIIDQSLGPLGHPTYLEYVKDILSAGRHLLDVISDILDMARIEAGRLTLEEESVDLGRTVGQILRMMALPALHKQLDLSADLPDDLPILVADARRVRQILLNLVTNAIKFTPGGGAIAVSVRIDASEGLVLAITDTGIGIAPEHITTALAPFGRVENTLSRREEGTGLGLPLTKALLESHGGRLELLSQPGQGTEARAIFPVSRLKTAGYA